MSRSAALATGHLLLTLAIVGFSALFARSPAFILGVTVYAGTCDVLWRTTQARGPYEGAKYALIFSFAAMAIRFLSRPRNTWPSLLLLALLIPGAILGMLTLGVVTSREYIVANLAGMIALALGVLVCSNFRLSQREIRGSYLLALSPILSIATIAAVGAFSTSTGDFSDASNFAASGGFGPVQVSSILCFGALLCVLVLLQPSLSAFGKLLAVLTGTWMVAQAVLTFSRGGVFSLVIALSCVGLAALTTRGQRGRTIVAAGLLVLVAIQILSWAGAFTDDASSERFSSTDSSNRTEIAEGDLKLFGSHPIVGVGVGVAAIERDFSVRSAPHTEYTRLLAEHGIFGIGVMGALAALTLRIVRGGRGWFRMAAVGLVVMSLAQMAHSATRIGVIPLGFALAALLEDTRESRGSSTDVAPPSEPRSHTPLGSSR